MIKDCDTTGPHWNPKNVNHGLLGMKIYHNGDLGNVLINQNGTLITEISAPELCLDCATSVVGRSVVLHEKLDDGGITDAPLSKTSGNAGSRIACGSIVYQK